MKRATLIFIHIGFLIVAAWTGFGCSSGDANNKSGNEYDVQSPDGSGAGNESWTVLVYMVADNDLESFALQDLNEMMDVSSSENLNIIVQCDRAEGYDRNGVGPMSNWVSTKRLEVTQDSMSEVSDLGERNMGLAPTLEDFIEWGITQYPADRYFLVLWNHGASWPGFGSDRSGGSDGMLSLAALRKGISDGLQRTSLSRFDIIGFDACLMATYETAVTLKDLGLYLLASEELEPGHGWDYFSLQSVHDNPSLDPENLGMKMLDGYMSQAIDLEQDQAVTLSLVKLEDMHVLTQAVDQLSNIVVNNLESSELAVIKARQDVQEFGKQSQKELSMNMVDLGDFAERLSNIPLFTNASQAVSTALKSVVVKSVKGSEIAHAQGLAIYLPSHSQYYNPSYDSVAGIEPWRTAIKSVLAEMSKDTNGPVFTNPNKQAVVDFPTAGGFLISGQLDLSSAEDLASSYLLYGIATDETAQTQYILGSNPAQTDSSGLVAGFWDGSALTLSQGGLQALGFLNLESTEEGAAALVTVPFAYTRPGLTQYELVFWLVVVDIDTGDSIQDTFYLYSDGFVGELFPQPGGALYPLVIQIDHSGEQFVISSTEGFDPMLEIEPDLETLNTGAISVLYLIAEDYAENSDNVWALQEL
jgi:hypothetical protein